MKIIKFTAIFLLLLLLLFHPFTTPVASAELPPGGNVYYNRVTTTYPVMNAAGVNDPGFLRQFIGENNDSVFNVAPAFQRNRSSGAAEAPDNLVFGTTFRHANDDNTYNVEYVYRIDSTLNAAIKKGDLQVSLTANLTNDKHWNLERHRSNWTAYPDTWLQTWSKILLDYDTSDYHSDTTQTMGKYNFVPVGTDPYNNYLLFGAAGQVCTCGSSKVSNISIILADTAGPRATAITVNRKQADGSLQPYSAFKAGDTMYITMKFDEYIRFANDQAMSLANAPKLKLELRGMTDNVVKAIPAEANLISLDKDTLTFAYQVPASYQTPEGEISVNHYVSAIAPYLDQTSWISSDDTFGLKLFGKTTSQVNYLNYNSKTTSLIVDMAGNPVDIGGSTRTLHAVAYMDSVPPTVQSIDVAGMTGSNGGEATVSDVFARVGDRVGFFVQFSEELLFVRQSTGELVRPDRGYMDNGLVLPGAKNLIFLGSEEIELLAELNISSGGSPVTAVAQYVTTVREKDGSLASRVYFTTSQPVSTDISPLVYADGTQLPVGINRIYLSPRYSSGNYVLADTRGNAYDTATKYIDVPTATRLLPKQQLWLDLVKPTASTNLIAAGGRYQPVTYGVDQNATAFCFPVLALDPLVASEKYASGTNGVTGYFMWRDIGDLPPPYVDKYPFEYAVTASSEQPADSAYKPAMTYGKIPFTQIDSSNFIHIRFVDGVDYNFATSQLVVYPVDNANNQGEASFTLDFTVDRRAPDIVQTSFSTQYYGTNQGSIYSRVQLRDVSPMSSVEYQWTALGASPTDAWLPVTSYTTGTYGRYKAFNFSLERGSLQSGINHQYSLHVRGTDAAGYTSTTKFDYQLDLRYPAYGLEFATDPTQPSGQHSLLLSPSGGDKQADVVYVLVKQPLENHTQYPNIVWYWRKTIDMSSIGANPVDLLAIDENATGWQECDVNSSHTLWRDDPSEPLIYWKPVVSYSDRGLSDKAGFINYMKQYKPLEVTIIARQDWKYYLTDWIFWDEVYAKNTYTLNNASDYLIGDAGTINRIIITPKSTVSPGDLGTSEVLTGSPDQLPVPRSLDGAVFGVSLSNARYSAYGLKDIDFESGDTLFALYETGEGAAVAPVYTTKLVAKSYQEVTIPAGIAQRSGTYKAVVSVKAYGSDHIDRNEYANILLDRRELDTYGVSQVSTSQLVAGLTAIAVSTDYPVAADERPSAIYVSAVPGAEQYVQFAAKAETLPVNGQPHYATYLKVWNETANALLGTDPAYHWIYLPAERQYRTVLLTDDNKVQILADLASTDVAKAAIIPILPGANVIKYQLAFPGGYQTPEQTLLIEAGEQTPTIAMQLSPQPIAGMTTNSDVVATIDVLTSPLVDPATLQLGMLNNAALNTAFAKDRQVTLTENGDYYFYALDKYHNFGYQQVTVDYIDRQGPELAVTNQSDVSQNNFQFEIVLQDDFGADNCQLYLQFDDAYLAVLGAPPGTVFQVPLVDQWQATDVSRSGLAAVSTIDGASGAKIVTVSGTFKYDNSAAAPAKADRAITIYAVDAAGNKSAYTATLTDVPNQPTTYLSGALAQGGFAATFNRPVVLTVPVAGTPAPNYARTKYGLPFYSNGSYPVDAVDIFGDRFAGNITVDQYDEFYACSVTVSQTTPTNQDVQVILNTAFNLGLTLQLPGSIDGRQVSPVLNAAGEVVGAEIVMSQNGTFSYELRPRDSAYATVTRSLSVQNIDKTPPQVELNWVYTADVVDGQTAGEIIVSLQGNEDLQGLEGTGTTHIFTLSDQSPYIFHYADLAGNEGYITATCSTEVVGKSLVPADTLAPDYELAIYRSASGQSSKVAGYTKTTYEQLTNPADRAAAFPLFAGMLQLRFTVYDDNQTTLTIQDGPIDGVSQSGNTVTVSNNADFVVVLTDAVGNQTLVPISIIHADNTPPTGTVTYVRTAPYVVRGYLQMADPGGGAVSLKNTSGVQVETIAGVDRFYHEFRDNESFTFVFADAAGNIGTTVAIVSSLDMTPPSGNVSKWVPYFVDQSGIVHPGVLSDRPTNSDVSVYLQFNKAIQSLTPQVTSGSLQDISISQTEDSATVVFRQNAALKLTFASLNGRSSSLSLTVDIIDKLSPEISATQTAANFTAVTYTLTSNEPVFLEDSDSVSPAGTSYSRIAGTSFSKVFQLNGDYDLRFTDLAGNTTVKRVSVTTIDRTPPSLTITGLPASGAAMTNQAVNFSAAINEPGTISFRGVVYSVSAGASSQLKVDNNGTYEIVATDRAGLITRYSVTVSCIDKTPPQILLSNQTLLIKQRSTMDALKTMVLEQVQVYDNADLHPAVSVSDLSDENLNTPGEYLVWVSATDAAGNYQFVRATVRVYGPNELQLRVNGALAPSGGTMFVAGKGSRVITVTMENVPVGSGGAEPYRIYWKRGLCTDAQMKNATQLESSFTAPQDGFYTIYVVTQSKVSLLTYIYLQH